MNKVDQLPSELVSLILSYVNSEDLPSCALINKSFYREATPLLWHKISIWSDKSFFAIPTCLMQSPHAPGRHVRSLAIRNKYRYTDILEQVQDVPGLESLDNLQHIPRYCPHLTSLEIECTRQLDPDVYRISHATVVSVGHYCKQLTKLVLDDCVYSDYDDLFDALKDAPLTDIQLSVLNILDTETLQRFLETAPLALHRYPLTNLYIRANDDATSFITTINTHGLTWPHLTSFDVRFCESLTDAMALTFVRTNPTIEDLRLDYSGVTDVFLDGLALPNLTHLGLNYTAITAPGICRLITNYDGRLDGVDCGDCGIEPEDVPNDKTYHYYRQWDEGEELDVAWFSGTFS